MPTATVQVAAQDLGYITPAKLQCFSPNIPDNCIKCNEGIGILFSLHVGLSETPQVLERGC